MDKTSMTLSDGYNTYTIEVDKVDMGLDNLVEEVLIPLLLAATYDYRLIKEVFGCDS
jgi:hypothetical protein